MPGPFDFYSDMFGKIEAPRLCQSTVPPLSFNVSYLNLPLFSSIIAIAAVAQRFRCFAIYECFCGQSNLQTSVQSLQVD